MVVQKLTIVGVTLNEKFTWADQFKDRALRAFRRLFPLCLLKPPSGRLSIADSLFRFKAICFRMRFTPICWNIKEGCAERAKSISSPAMRRIMQR